MEIRIGLAAKSGQETKKDLRSHDATKARCLLCNPLFHLEMERVLCISAHGKKTQEDEQER